MKHHRGDPHGHAEEAKARKRGGSAHQRMLKTGGASRHERKRGGGIPGEEKIKEGEREDDERKRGGKVHGEKPKHRLDKRARGGAMTPKSPLTGAGGGKPPFKHPDMPLDDGGEGTYAKRKHGGRTKKRAMGGAMTPTMPQTAMPGGTQFKRGGHKRARGGGMMGKKEGEGASCDGRSKGGHITTAERKRLPSSEFALPGKGAGASGKGPGSYPIDTPARARNALARGAQHASPGELATIKRKVHAKFPDIGQR